MRRGIIAPLPNRTSPVSDFLSRLGPQNGSGLRPRPSLVGAAWRPQIKAARRLQIGAAWRPQNVTAWRLQIRADVRPDISFTIVKRRIAGARHGLESLPAGAPAGSQWLRFRAAWRPQGPPNAVQKMGRLAPPRRGPNWFSDCKKPYSMCAVLVRVRLSGGWYQD